MALSSIGLPNSIDAPFFKAGFESAKGGQSSYLRFDAGDSQSFTVLASGDSSSPDKGNLTVLSKAAGPVPVQRPLVIKPDGSVTTGALSCSALTVNGQPYNPSSSGGVPSVNGITKAVTIAGDSTISVTPDATAGTVTLSVKSSPASAGVSTLNGLSGPLSITGSGAATVTASGSSVNVAVAANGFPVAGTPTFSKTVVVGTGAGGQGVDIWSQPVFDTSTWPQGTYVLVVLGILDGSNPQDTNSPFCASTVLTKWGWFTAALPAVMGTGPDSTNGDHPRYVFGPPATGYYAPPGFSATAYKGVVFSFGGTNYQSIIASADSSVTQTLNFQCSVYQIA